MTTYIYNQNGSLSQLPRTGYATSNATQAPLNSAGASYKYTAESLQNVAMGRSTQLQIRPEYIQSQNKNLNPADVVNLMMGHSTSRPMQSSNNSNGVSYVNIKTGLEVQKPTNGVSYVDINNGQEIVKQYMTNDETKDKKFVTDIFSKDFGKVKSSNVVDVTDRRKPIMERLGIFQEMPDNERKSVQNGLAIESVFIDREYKKSQEYEGKLVKAYNFEIAKKSKYTDLAIDIEAGIRREQLKREKLLNPNMSTAVKKKYETPMSAKGYIPFSGKFHETLASDMERADYVTRDSKLLRIPGQLYGLTGWGYSVAGELAEKAGLSTVGFGLQSLGYDVKLQAKNYKDSPLSTVGRTAYSGLAGFSGGILTANPYAGAVGLTVGLGGEMSAPYITTVAETSRFTFLPSESKKQILNGSFKDYAERQRYAFEGEDKALSTKFQGNPILQTGFDFARNVPVVDFLIRDKDSYKSTLKSLGISDKQVQDEYTLSKYRLGGRTATFGGAEILANLAGTKTLLGTALTGTKQNLKQSTGNVIGASQAEIMTAVAGEYTTKRKPIDTEMSLFSTTVGTSTAGVLEAFRSGFMFKGIKESSNSLPYKATSSSRWARITEFVGNIADPYEYPFDKVTDMGRKVLYKDAPEYIYIKGSRKAVRPKTFTMLNTKESISSFVGENSGIYITPANTKSSTPANTKTKTNTFSFLNSKTELNSFLNTKTDSRTNVNTKTNTAINVNTNVRAFTDMNTKINSNLKTDIFANINTKENVIIPIDSRTNIDTRSNIDVPVDANTFTPQPRGGFPLMFPSGVGGLGSSKRKKVKTRYTASFDAFILGIYAKKKPKKTLFTGNETRPLIGSPNQNKIFFPV